MSSNNYAETNNINSIIYILLISIKTNVNREENNWTDWINNWTVEKSLFIKKHQLNK